MSDNEEYDRNPYIDFEAELSEGEDVSEDELELSGDDEDDKELVADDEDEPNSEDEELVRNLYQKQLNNEDKRQVLLLKEQLEDKAVALGPKRHKRFNWQIDDDDMDRLGKHDDMDEDDDEDDDGPLDEEDDAMFMPRLRPPPQSHDLILNDASESNSNFPSVSSSHPKLSSVTTTSSNSAAGSSNINKFLFRDKETVDALSATNRPTVKASREDKERIIEREVKKVLESKSIFDRF